MHNDSEAQLFSHTGQHPYGVSRMPWPKRLLKRKVVLRIRWSNTSFSQEGVFLSPDGTSPRIKQSLVFNTDNLVFPRFLLANGKTTASQNKYQTEQRYSSRPCLFVFRFPYFQLNMQFKIKDFKILMKRWVPCINLVRWSARCWRASGFMRKRMLKYRNKKGRSLKHKFAKRHCRVWSDPKKLDNILK